jgi:hypothetical chaperone protein
MRIDRVGIDFGTSNTAASVRGERDGTLLHEIIPLDRDDLLKTLLYFPNGRESFFGRSAIEQYFEHEREGRFFQSIKRLLPNPDFSGTQISGRFVSLESLIARFLEDVKRRLEATLGLEISRLPVTFGRPALYSLDEKRETLATERFKEAIRLAGFQHFTLLEEPTAASRAAFRRPRTISEPESLTLVADLGGGTSDFTLLRTTHGRESPEVLAVHGVPLAGDAMDSAFVQARLLPYFGSEVKYQRPFSSNILTFPTALISRIPKWHQHVVLKERSNWNFMLELKKELVNPHDRAILENLLTLVEENLGYEMHQSVERLKFEASLHDLERAFQIPFSFRSYPIDIQFPVTPADYRDIIAPIVTRVATAASETLKLAGMDGTRIATLNFTGGTSKTPAMREAIQALVPKAKVEDQDSFTAVALGLSLD